MSLNHIIESWRDEEYRESLDSETRSLLPVNPAGEIELLEADLVGVDGGLAMMPPTTVSEVYNCNSFSWLSLLC